MLEVGVVTLFPEMLAGLEICGITGRAVASGRLALRCFNPREYARDRHRTVDDRPYGGGPGMVMTVGPTRDAIRAARGAVGEPVSAIYLSPQGRRLTQAGAAELAARARLVLVCGRYEGLDERLVETEIDEEVSVGDYVLSGGEVAAMVLIEALARLLPGALGHEDSAAQDSFVAGRLDCPHFTRPETAGARGVPEVLLSGDHAAIARWRRKQSVGRTWLRRPDLLRERPLDSEERGLLEEFLAENLTEGSRRQREREEGRLP